MRPLSLSLALLASLSAAALAARVSVPGTTLSLELPAGFKPMDAATIALKYPRGQPPAVVYTAAEGQVDIAFARRGAKLPADQLNDFGTTMKTVISRQLTGLKWEKTAPRRIGGRDWYELAFTFQAADQPIYQRLLVSSYEGSALVVTVNATVAQLPKYRGILNGVVDSIRY